MARFGVRCEREGWQRFIVPAGSRYVIARRDLCRRRCLVRLLFPRGWAPSAAGRCASKASARDSIQGDVRFAEALAADGRAASTRGANWMEAQARQAATESDRPGLQPHPGCGDDAGGGGAVCRGHDHAAQHRQLARQGDRPHRRHGHRTAQARRRSRRGRGFHRVTPPSSSSHAAIDTYDDHRIAMCFSLAAFGGDAGAHQRSATASPRPSRIISTLFDDVVEPCAGDRHRRPVRLRQGHGGALVAAGLGYHYLDSAARCTAAGACGTARRGSAGRTKRAWRNWPHALEIRFEGEQIWLDGALVGDALRTEQCGAIASKVAALPGVRAALLAGSMLSAGRRVWSRMGATWARWCFPMPH